MSSTDDIPDQSAKTRVLLAITSAFAKFDVTQAKEALREAIRSVNHTKTPNVDSFSVLRRVELSCPDNPAGKFYGSSERVEHFSLLGTFALVSTSDPEGMLAEGRNIDDPGIRIRALASIIGGLAATSHLK